MLSSLLPQLSDFVRARLGLHFPPERFSDLERGVRAAAAELLAVKLDGLRTSDSAAAAAAAPALVRQLGETLRELRGEREDVDAVRRMLEPLRRAA